jgi:hypothetical protein|tara:strand:+ start:452 stop:853 length:402 start_codon:yes stop_codon:yes gene_type:complete
MDIAELKGTVLRRFQELTDTEQSIVETMGDTVVGEVILKLIGPELNEVFSEPEDETERMLAERTVGEPPNILPPDEDIPDLAKDMPEEFRERPSMPSAGPNPEQYRVDPTRPEFKRPRPEETDTMMKREMASR